MLNLSAALKRRPTHLAGKLGDVTRWPGLRLKGYTLAFGESPGMTLPLVGMTLPLVEGKAPIVELLLGRQPVFRRLCYDIW